MGFLAGLLPGFRQLRAPLSAGLLWMLALWLLVEPELRHADTSTGLLASLESLRGTLSPVGTTAVFGFAAYILGSVSEALTSGLVALSRNRPSANSVSGLEWISDHAHRRLGDFLISKLVALGLRLWDEAQITIFRDHFVDHHPDLFDGLDSLHDLSEVQAPSNPNPGHRYSPLRFMYRRLLIDATRADFPLIRRRLIGNEPELYSEIDRLHAEAELREATAAPFVALAVVIASRTPYLIGVVVVAVGSAIVTVLLWQARARRIEAGDALADALVIGRVGVPFMEQLEAELNTAVERVKRNPDLRKSDKMPHLVPGDEPQYAAGSGHAKPGSRPEPSQTNDTP